LNREARLAAREAADSRGFRYAKVAFWAIAPASYGLSMTVQVTASNPDGTFAQFPWSVAL